MRGIAIIFNGESTHTGNDLDLVQEKKDIGKPDIQSYTVSIPGRNGLLNLTRSLTGKVTYNNRPLTFQYFGTGKREALLELDAYFSTLHGQTIRIIDDDYPDHYYEGEVEVSTELKGNYITINLAVDAYPFRLKLLPTIRTYTPNGTTKIYLDNESIDVLPKITVTGETSITFKGTTVHISAGEYILENVVLSRGVNILEISSFASITFEYQEGAI